MDFFRADPGRLILSVLFVVAGVAHFRNPSFYERMMRFLPSSLSWLHLLAGVCEIAGAIGLSFGPFKRECARGLLTLLVCVFPANVYCALNPDLFPEMSAIGWWLRLPIQIPLCFWTWMYC
jgi:uncharacterized membrane protein